jgi:hypothetical protein
MCQVLLLTQECNFDIERRENMWNFQKHQWLLLTHCIDHSLSSVELITNLKSKFCRDVSRLNTAENKGISLHTLCS